MYLFVGKTEIWGCRQTRAGLRSPTILALMIFRMPVMSASGAMPNLKVELLPTFACEQITAGIFNLLFGKVGISCAAMSSNLPPLLRRIVLVRQTALGATLDLERR